MLNEIKQVIGAEETEDASLRQQYGAKWVRKPSSEINAQYKQVIQESEMKLGQAAQADAGTQQKFESLNPAFTLLAKTRAELTAMLPQTNKASADQNPSVMAMA